MVSAAVLPLTSFVTGPVLARALGPTGRGQVAAVMAPIFVTMSIASMAVPDGTAYAIARGRVPTRRATWWGSMLVAAYGTAAAVGLYFAAPTMLRASPDVIGLLRAAVWTLPAIMIANLLERAAHGARRYRQVNISRVTSALSRFVVLVALAVAARLTVSAAVWVQIVAIGLVPLVVLGRMLVTRVPTSGAVGHSRLVRDIATFGVVGWGGVFSQMVNYRLDQALLPAFVSSDQIGFYVIAASFVQIPIIVAQALRSALMSETSHRNDQHLVARVSRIMIACTAVSALTAALAAQPLVILLFGEDFAPAVPLAQLMFAGTVAFVGEQMLAAGLLAAGRPGRRSAGQVIAAIITVLGLILLLPRIGVTGAAVTTVTAYAVNFLVTLGIYSREVGISPRQSLVVTRHDLQWVRRLVRERSSR